MFQDSRSQNGSRGRRLFLEAENVILAFMNRFDRFEPQNALNRI